MRSGADRWAQPENSSFILSNLAAIGQNRNQSHKCANPSQKYFRIPGTDVRDSLLLVERERLEPAVSVPVASAMRSSQCVDHIENVLMAVLADAQQRDFLGFSKHDALNAGWLEMLAGSTRITRLVAIQLVMRSPFHIRPLIGVRPARNAKGIALFAQAYLSCYRRTARGADATQARELLDWLCSHSSRLDVPCWGYPYPWQDVGFFAPRDFPNRVVSSFVVHALVDGYETFGDRHYLKVAEQAVRFLLDAPKTLFDDKEHRCLSYVPAEEINWIVMDVSALVGAVAARVAAHMDDPAMMAEAGRLIRYVASKQTNYHAWFYSEPPSDSHITHDNYHTGFILDAILQYGKVSGSREFERVYDQGLAYYRTALFEADGAPRFMNDQRYPYDIHGAAQGIITFSLAHADADEDMDMAHKILVWTIQHMYDPRTNWFYYQKRRGFRTRVRLLRWCQAWMARAISCHLEHCKG